MEPRFENLGEGLLQGGDQIISIVIGTSNKKTAPALLHLYLHGAELKMRCVQVWKEDVKGKDGESLP